MKGILRKISHFFTDLSCKNDVTFGMGTKFTRTAKVENISKNKKNINIGNFSRIEGRLVVFKYGGRIDMGDFVYIGTGSNIWSGESVFIGNNVLISHNVNIIDTNSHEIDHYEREIRYKSLLNYGHPIDKSSIITGPIVIEDNVWISFGASILKNVTIGKGSIVAACSVVTKDVPSFCLVAGNPAKVVKKLN
ncbi:acyltransferase [Algoriphagus lacus]|uniref:acyltransferase n=1 Tax=Algoriphagus lacus TaxID=2056311 RepID=UPI001314D1CA|nr:acyltransferase [Algoriphagus lacus]